MFTKNDAEGQVTALFKKKRIKQRHNIIKNQRLHVAITQMTNCMSGKPYEFSLELTDVKN